MTTTRTVLGRTSTSLLLTIGLLAGLAAISSTAVGAAEANDDTGSCSEPLSHFVEWDIDDVKRVQVRSSLGWVGTVNAPTDHFSARDSARRNTGTYFVRAKLNSGEVVEISCASRPYLPLTVPAATEPACNVTETRFGPRLYVVNTSGSMNLRDENGWVGSIDKASPQKAVSSVKDTFTVINRNPVEGRIEISCTTGDRENLALAYGGEKAAETPGLAPQSGDYELVELDFVEGDFVIRNNATGATRTINTGAGSDFYPRAVSVDGTIVTVEDAAEQQLFEVHLDTATGELTYYMITK